MVHPVPVGSAAKGGRARAKVTGGSSEMAPGMMPPSMMPPNKTARLSRARRQRRHRRNRAGHGPHRARKRRGGRDRATMWPKNADFGRIEQRAPKPPQPRRLIRPANVRCACGRWLAAAMPRSAATTGCGQRDGTMRSVMNEHRRRAMTATAQRGWRA